MLHVLAEHPVLAGLALLVLMAAQSAPVTGFFLPGIVVLPLLGALTGSGFLPFWSMFACIVTGAWLGDVLGFWVGRRARGTGSRWEANGLEQTAVQAAHGLVKRHGALSVVLGRFVWFIHPVVPPVIGLADLRPRTFILLDLPAVILWAMLYTGFGHIVTGVWLRQSARTIEVVGLVGIVLLIFLISRHLFTARARGPR